MTVIAYRDGYIASDTQISGEYLKILTTPGQPKILKVKDTLFGTCGDAVGGRRWLKWAEKHWRSENDTAMCPYPYPDSDNEFNVIRVDPDDTVHVLFREGWLSYGHQPYFAIGSGADIAFGAMYAGANAAAAVRAAIHHGVSCGGMVNVLCREDPELD